MKVSIMLVSLIIPCYNEFEALPFLYEAICDVASKCSDKSFEYIFVDDGSKDETLSRLKEMAEKDERVHYVSFSRNFGKEAAMFAGLSEAKGDLVGIMDADMQDPPSLLPEMFTMLKMKMSMLLRHVGLREKANQEFAVFLRANSTES